LFILENGLPGNRLVVTFARKFGNAVKRNRARRVSREGYRLLKNRLKTGFDLVMLVYPAGQQRTASRLESASGLETAPVPAVSATDCLAVRIGQLRNLFNRAGLFAENR
jgi:ribonuclease P protein component